MVDFFIIIKGIILTEALSTALKDWKIFDTPRIKLQSKYSFFRDLFSCFQCISVWVAFFIICYLLYFEWPIFTWAIIFHRAATFIQNAWLILDWKRANAERDFIEKVERLKISEALQNKMEQHRVTWKK